MKSQKIVSRRRTLHARHAAPPRPHSVAAVELDEPDPVEMNAQNGDSVPQPIEDWSDDDDDANRWLHEHRFDGGEHFDIN